jgi:murein L,D-transpeptidase YcbB/YkuD
MSVVRLDRFFASTAVLLLLTASATSASAEPMTEKQITAAVPMPDTAAVPPPTASDINKATVKQSDPPAATETPAPTDTKAVTPAPADEAVKPVPADTQTASPAPTTPALAPADAAIAEKLRDLANGKFDRLVGGKKERGMIDAFYSGRDYAPLWLTNGVANDRAKSAMTFLAGVAADGLDPSDYPVPNFKASSDPAVLAENELQLTNSVLTFAHHAQLGRVHWSRVSADIFYNQTAPEPADVLADMAGAKDVGEALDAFNPQQPGYKALKAKLAEIRGNHGEPVTAHIAGGATLKVGMQDARVPQLRERLGLTGDGNAYDKALAEAVKKFQQQHKINATGTLTTATVDALNGKTPDHAADIIVANMERWRWLPRNLGKTYVMVNIPDFRLHVMNNGHEVWTTKIVTGKPAMPTPIMTAEMKYITVNPTWNVPPSIVANEYLPALQQDPTVLQRMGLRVTHNPDGSVHISQPPGDGNALGRLRFNFPNKFLVYQHDTPDKYLFARDVRDFSHGCMRVQDPAKYAEVLLSLVRPSDGYTAERLKKMFGPNEVDIQFPTFVPVHLTYQTAFVDDSGKLQFRDDIYGRDRQVLALLKGDERKVADTPIERKENAVRRQALALPDSVFSDNRVGAWGSRGAFGDGGGNFFARLFGFGAPPQPPPTPRKPVGRPQHRTEAR